MRFCSVARDTRSAFASDTSEARASSRSRPISCWSMSSIAALLVGTLCHLGGILRYGCSLVVTLLAIHWLWPCRKSVNQFTKLIPGSFIMVDYIGVSDIRRIVSEIGVAPFIERLADEIEADY